MAQRRRQQPRGPHQLPPGRHKLPREYVTLNQRERIFDAIIEVASLAGYVHMSVEEITATAGVSRRTFYDLFGTKDEAFLAALDHVSGQLVARVRAAYAANDTFAGGVRDCLGAFLGFVAEEPRYGDLLVVETLAAGAPALERRNELIRVFTAMVRRGAERLTNGRRPPELTAEAVVGGIYEIVYSRILQGRAGELPSMLPDLAYSMMQPYIGHQAAKREAAKPVRTVAVEAGTS